MDAAGYGYYRVWKERAYLAKLAFVPIMIKFACTIAIFSLDLDNNYLRQGLILLPAMFAEGWVLAQFLRTLLKAERWPITLPDAPDAKLVGKLLNRARGIIAAVLVYVLIGMVSFFARYLAFEFLPSDEEIESARLSLEEQKNLEANLSRTAGNDSETQPSNGFPAFLAVFSFIPMVLFVLVTVWTFRLMWIYIPLSVLMPIKYYLKSVSGFMSSVYMIILFLACMAPATFIAIMLAQVVYGATNDLTGSLELLGHFIGILLSVITEIIVSLISTAAFAWAMRDFLPRSKESMSDFPGDQTRYKD